MGRKVCLKKIENVTRCQVTFSKRRSSLIKKAHEISICCDAEVALLAFSPSGRISKFSSPKRIEEVIHRYVNLPADMRFNDMDDVKEKLGKLQQLNHINGDQSKLYYLDKQLENLELQIKKSTEQLQILETDIRVYEPQEKEPTLDQLLWHENNIKNSLGKVIERKNVISVGISLAKEQQKIPMVYEGVTPSLDNFSGRDSNARGSNSSNGKLPMQIDSWLVPPSAEVHEGLIQNRINQGNRKTMCNQGLVVSTSYSTRGISGKIKSQIPFKLQTPRPIIMRETQFVPPVENAFRSAAQSYPETPNRSVFGSGSGSGSFRQTLYDIQPSDLERTSPLPLGENIFADFSINNGQTGIDKCQTRIDQMIPAPGNLNIGINKHNGNGIMNTNIFYNQNVHNSGITGCGRGIGESNPPQDLSRDDPPRTSYSQARESGLLDPKYGGLNYKNLKNLKNLLN